MKLLLDECVDRRFAKDLPGYEVKTVPQMGWAGIENGALLARAEAGFDVFIPVDRNLAFQQNLSSFTIAVLILRAPSNRLEDLKSLTPKVLAALPTLLRGQSIEVGI